MRSAIVRQFGKPSGLLGRLVGFVMRVRPSNRERNRRTLRLLEIRPDDHVLEIGFGPGLAIQGAAELATRGKVVGIDHSELMLKKASHRNAQAIGAGRVELYVARAERIPRFSAPFDKAFAVNVFMFWEDPLLVLAGVRKAMKLCGTVAITFQSRSRKATTADTRAGAERIACSLRDAGFQNVTIEMLQLRGVDAACVLGHAPESN